NKVYDGNTTAVISGATLVGVVSPDDVTLANHTTGVFAQAAIGADIAVSTLPMTITGAGIGNYTLTQPTGLKANITAKPITITANGGQSKIYGETDPTPFTYTFVPALIGSDVITGLMGRVAGENAGTFAFTLGTMTAGPNYSLVVSASPTFTITPKALTITADNKSKCFDGSVYSGGYTVTYSGFVTGEGPWVLGGALLFSGSAITATIPGTYDILPSGLTSGNYTITYQSGTLTIFVLPEPVIAGEDDLCVNSGYFNYTTEPGMSNYVWTVSTGGTINWGSGTNQIEVVWHTAGAQTVSINYTNPSGCSPAAPTVLNVTVDPLPGAAGNITGTVAICGGTQGIAYSTTPIAGALTYVWTLPAGATIISGAGTTEISVDFDQYASSGNITVYGNNLCGNGLASPPFVVTVTPVPDAPVVTSSGDTLMSSAPAGNQWYFSPTGSGGDIIPGATGQTWIATETGWYWTVVTLNGCESESSNVVHVVITGVVESFVSRFYLYPVPNEGIMTASITSPIVQEVDLRIYNKIGQVIFEVKDMEVDGKFEYHFDLRPIPNGVYTVILQKDKGMIIRKFVVNK
ncbi:MAG: MBG domain-containing protein, partial [bacterium]